MQIIVVAFIGLITSFLSNIAGGGGSLILLPALLAIGLSPLNAIGTIKAGAIGLVIGSVASSKGKGLVRKDYLGPLFIIVFLASLVGPQLSVHLPEAKVKVISSLFIIVTSIVAIFSWRLSPERRAVKAWQRNLGYMLYFITITLLAGFGSAIGLLGSYILLGLLGMSALETTATRRLVGVIGAPVQLIAFILSGHVNLAFGLAAGLGSAIGGYIGLNTAFKQGNLFVKRAMGITAILLVASLFV